MCWCWGGFLLGAEAWGGSQLLSGVGVAVGLGVRASVGYDVTRKLFGEDVWSMVRPAVGENVILYVGTGVGYRVRACTMTIYVTVTPIDSSFWSTAKNMFYLKASYT